MMMFRVLAAPSAEADCGMTATRARHAIPAMVRAKGFIE
jgi:hypothetical protein